MSGFEVAGVVLGAFPLLVSALEHYHDCAELVDDWWSYTRRFQKCQNKVNFLYLDFSSLLKQMLLPLVCDERHAKALIANSDASLWRDPHYEAALKDRLKDTYIYYQQAIEEINEIMQKLKHEMGCSDETTEKVCQFEIQCQTMDQQDMGYRCLNHTRVRWSNIVRLHPDPLITTNVFDSLLEGLQVITFSRSLKSRIASSEDCPKSAIL